MQICFHLEPIPGSAAGYEKNEYWASCRSSCEPGEISANDDPDCRIWSLGRRVVFCEAFAISGLKKMVQNCPHKKGNCVMQLRDYVEKDISTYTLHYLIHVDMWLYNTFGKCMEWCHQMVYHHCPRFKEYLLDDSFCRAKYSLIGL